MDRALSYIGLAKKAGALEIGETDAGAAVRAGKARLLILASDASDNAKRRAEGFVCGTQTPLRTVPFTKETLSRTAGAGGCAMAAFTDLGLAAAFAGALAGAEPSFSDAAALLAQKDQKARQRRHETLAHGKKRGRDKAEGPKATGMRRRNV
ncbi:MAG: 50S ribosomal protein L7 [Oscillospiraceae bacterium]|jgi:ribosomal protein L7Ae-like RNA K-turn-binding protein|nr:50S ribosomal protein L7 [Oscillospiraceae bacterium]